MKYSFANDYSEGAHPRILEQLLQTNLQQNPGYGTDEHCKRAADLIRTECGNSDLDVHFIPGGTLSNVIAIASALRAHEAVVSAETGHINRHETGAIEATGHKILTASCPDGKLTRAAIEEILRIHNAEFTVVPKLVYLSNTTELGTQYTKEDLQEISHLCRQRGLYLFLDGARLASALTSSSNDLTMKDLAELTDFFYIGGTKNGALFGEALVIRNPELKPYFRYHIKQRGALTGKGWLMGLQFEVLFSDGLYYELGRHANEMAAILRKGFEDLGIPFLSDSNSNQIFPIVSNRLANVLAEDYRFETEHDFGDGRTAIRFVTSWATPEKAVREFLSQLSLLI